MPADAFSAAKFGAPQRVREMFGRGTAVGAGDGLVEADRALAGRWGVRGVLFFVADARVAVSGARAPAVFEEFLCEVWAKTRNDRRRRVPASWRGASAVS